MEEVVRQELVAKTRQALDVDDWDAVMRIWEPWIEHGDPEAEYQLAYHYLWWWTPVEDDAMRERMEKLLADAAAQGHPDAIWLLAQRLRRQDRPGADAEFKRLLLHAGHLGSVHAQRDLGVFYSTGDWSGPKDPAEGARWYRLAAQQGHAESQYDLGFMLLLGEGGPQNVVEGLMWLERAAQQGEFLAWRLLADCYQNGYCDVPVDAGKAALYRERIEEYKRLHPPKALRFYAVPSAVEESSLTCLLDIDGVDGFSVSARTNDKELAVGYDSEVIAPVELDEKIRAAGILAVPME